MRGTIRHGCLLAGLLALSGCGYFGGDAEPDNADPAAPVAVPTAPVEKLELRLNVGDRFPLMKTVVQELHQASNLGPAASRSTIELLLTITVEELLPEKKRLGVRYNRVRYSQSIAGESFDFDSSQARSKVPKAALPYLGLVGNGFSFWIGRDNQILEPVGFDEFLQRCVRDVPAEERPQVLSRFAQTTADEGIANFVDDSIGLLPYEVDGKGEGGGGAEGDTWVRERRLMQPMPLYLRNRYTLRTLNQSVAKIDILGTLSPATTSDNSPAGIVPTSGTQPQPADPKQPQVVVRKGNTFGACTIDRGTGLPLHSSVERHLNMVVKMPDGLEFEQRKRTVTTIEAFPQQKPAAAESGPAAEPHQGPVTLPAAAAPAAPRSAGPSEPKANR